MKIMRSKKMIFLIFVLFCSIDLVAQRIAVTGKIIDEVSNPIVGASILEKGTTNGTVSDINGNFTLDVGKNSTLSISYIGYITRETQASEGRVLEVVLQEDTEILNEVVVVGTSMRKSDLTGAVSSVSAEILSEKPVTSINEALQGRVAGVFISSGTRPTDDAQIKIRGVNTITGSTNPIYVVDGMVLDNGYSGFSAINLNDVASIEVLKDASATALYGSRGSNGVVLVTTKKGRRGEGRVSYDGWVGIQEYAKVPKIMDTKQLFELRKEAYVNGFTQTNPNGNVNDFIENEVMNSNRVFADYEFEAYQNNDNYNWLDEVSRTGVEQNHNLSFSNASDRGAFYLSFGYSDNKGLIQKSGQKRYYGRINAGQNIKPWLKVGTNTSFTRTIDSLVDDGIMNRARNANPMLPISDEIETLNWQGIFDQNLFNPIRSLNIDNDRVIDRVMTTNFAEISFLDDFKFRSTYSLDYAQNQYNRYVPNDIYEAERYGTQGEATDNRDVRMVWQWDNSLTYEKVLDVHRINALIGTSATQTNGSWLNASSQGYGSNEFTYHSLNSGYKRDQRGLSSSWWKSTLLSYILRANYGYDNRYLLTATARYDGSSKFAEGYRWGLFPSISAAWNITEEEFMQEQDIFDQLKFRAGYGVVGNQNISDFAFLSLYYTNYSGTADKGYTYSFQSDGRRATKDISWEKQRQWNVGLDMTAFKNRLSFSVDAFMINNKDLLMSHSLPTTSGYSYTIDNIGAIENKGLEFYLGASLIQTKDFQWNFSGTLSMDKNKVTQLYGNADVVYNVDGDRNIQKEGNLFLGESRNTIYIWRTGGIAQVADMGRLNETNWMGYNVNPGDLYPLDVNEDGQIDQNDRVVIGSSDPKFYGGFSTDFNWKGLSLNAVFNYSYGAKRLSPYYESLIGSKGLSNASIDLMDRWTPENTSADFPRVLAGFDYNHYGAYQMDFSVQDASYLKLSALTLSYNLPQSLLNKLNVSSLRIYTTGSNLFTWTNYKGYDPETGDWYPPTKMYVVGVNFSF